MRKVFQCALLLVIVVFNISCRDYEELEIVDLPDGLINGGNTKVDKRLLAIGQFIGPLTCTATYVEVPNQTLDSPAYIITNGHCANEIFNDNFIYVNEPLVAEVIFKNLYGISEDQHLRFSTKKIAYSTMKGTDLAIIELNHSNRELQKAGIFPIKITSQYPVKGAAIQAYGYPLSLTPISLRVSKGELGKSSMLAEFIWLWNDFFATYLKNISSGSSGSPVFEDLSKGVFGIINTTTIDAVGTCELGAPCELEFGISPSTKFETSYILDITNIKSSFNSNGVFDINVSTNRLEKPSGLEVSFKDQVRNFGKKDLDNHKLTFHSNNLNSEYRVDPFESYVWDNLSGFSPINSAVTEINFPAKEGFYVLTVMANGNKNRLTFKMDFTEPDASLIRLNINKLESGDYIVHPIFIYPELVKFNWKICALNSCVCTDDKGFEFYNRIPRNIYRNELPVKICVVGYDLAGNPTKTREFILNE